MITGGLTARLPPPQRTEGECSAGSWRWGGEEREVEGDEKDEGGRKWREIPRLRAPGEVALSQATSLPHPIRALAKAGQGIRDYETVPCLVALPRSR